MEQIINERLAQKDFLRGQALNMRPELPRGGETGFLVQDAVHDVMEAQGKRIFKRIPEMTDPRIVKQMNRGRRASRGTEVGGRKGQRIGKQMNRG